MGDEVMGDEVMGDEVMGDEVGGLKSLHHSITLSLHKLGQKYWIKLSCYAELFKRIFVLVLKHLSLCHETRNGIKNQQANASASAGHTEHSFYRQLARL